MIEREVRNGKMSNNKRLQTIFYWVSGLAIMLVGLGEQFFTNEKFEGFVVWCFGFVICEIVSLTKEG